MKHFTLTLFIFVSCLATAQVKKIDFQDGLIIDKTNINVQFEKPKKSSSTTTSPVSVSYNTMDASSLAAIQSGLKPGMLNERNVPAFIEGTPKQLNTKGLSTDQMAIEYVSIAAPLMQIKNPSEAFKIVSSTTDELGMTHVKMQQQIQGVPVYGAEIIVHGEGQSFDFLNGRYFPSFEMASVTPSLDDQKIQAICHQDLGGIQSYDIDVQKLMGGAQTTSELVVLPTEQGFVLAYHITTYKNLVERWEYFIDANSGKVIKKYESICKFHNHKHEGGVCSKGQNAEASVVLDGKATANSVDLFNITRTINTYQVGTKYYMIDGSRDIFSSTTDQLPDDPEGVIWTIDAFNTSPQKSSFNYDHVTSTNNTWTNKTSVSAHYNGGKAFEYFRSVHSRPSINGQGGNIVSLINVADDDGSSMGNAFWNGAAMFYGNGDSAFKPLARGLDVAGHEMTHGVVQSTANLEYQGESGALNESFADIFGVMIDRDDWLVGEDVVIAAVFPSGALRSLQDPHNGASTNNFNAGWQPKVYSERYKGSEDNGGVHINSGIPNHAFYLFATAVGKDKAEKVYYRALSNYLTKSSQFVDCRIAVIKATTDLYGTSEVNAAKKAFDDVGIIGDQGGTYEVDNETNPGQEFILVTSGNNSGLYLYDTEGNALGTVSNTGVASKPSVSDDGSEIVFVGTDDKIHYIYIDWNASQVIPDEQIIGASPIWRNAIISKDGSKIAATTTQKVNEIIVFYFGATTTNNTFTLYNPTFSEGVSTGDVTYADAMEFDITGEYIIYDSENVINSTTSGSITYWDISFIKVWNNSSNSFSLGKIEKLYASLPENVSVGNPAFSKNSPYIIAFDYIDENGDVSLLGANIEQGNVKLIYENNTLSYPNYATKDNKIVFDNDGSSTTNTGIIDLKSNKIEPAANPFLFLNNRRWAVWFSNGKRTLSSTEDNVSSNKKILNILSNPVQNQLNIEVNVVNGGSSTVNITDINGQQFYSQEHSFSSGKNQLAIDIQSIPEGMYILRLDINNSLESAKFVKTN